MKSELQKALVDYLNLFNAQVEFLGHAKEVFREMLLISKQARALESRIEKAESRELGAGGTSLLDLLHDSDFHALDADGIIEVLTGEARVKRASDPGKLARRLIKAARDG